MREDVSRSLGSAARSMVAICVAGLVGAAEGCAWDLDHSGPDVQLIGNPPPVGSFPRLNGQPATSLSLLTGPDGAPWAAMIEAPTTSTPVVPGVPMPPAQQTLRLVRLTPPQMEELHIAGNIALGLTAIYLLDVMPGPTSALTIRSPGQAGTGDQFTLAGGKLLFGFDPTDQAFFSWVSAADTATFEVARRDHSFSRQLPVLPGVDPQKPLGTGSLDFSYSGDTLFGQDATGRVIAHSTRAAKDVDLGVQPRAYFADPMSEAIVACGPDGLRRVPADGSAPLVLDAGACAADVLVLQSDALIYRGSDGIRQVPLSGSGLPRVVGPAAALQALAISPDDRLVYSLDPPSLYGAGTGDGWLGGWPFMQRGTRVQFSADGTRIRWLEGAADSEHAGALLSTAVVPPGQSSSTQAPLNLGLNVRQYSEVASGKVLAIANDAYRGPQNRLVLIDEDTRTAQWVVDTARSFVLVPGTSDMLVQLVVGQTGSDVIRVPVPQ